MASIRLENLRKEFGPVVAVEELNLQIGDGEFAALLGPSGCGKTTTMNMIAGLETPTRGTIHFNDKPMNAVPAGKRGVGFVFQNYAIFTHMTVYDNVGFGLKVRGAPDAEIRREVDKIAQLLQMTDMLQMNAGRLSVNDMQKVALGRSMITNPSIFLLDEPFSNLDAAFRAYMRGELKRIQREVKQTMVYVTHDQIEAMSMADKIAVMYCGQLFQFGSPEEVYNRPVNTFVARFIGSPNMNFVNCGYAAEGDTGYLVQNRGPARMAIDKRRRPLVETVAGDGLILGIRPEHIRVTAEPLTSASWPGTTYAIEPLGSKTIVHIRVGTDSVQALAPADFRPRVNEALWLSFDEQRTHVFDAKTKDVIR